jgi:glycosyltransferase involved in cell wall biosynthesis
MKITIVGTAYPLRGGIAHFNALLAKHLGKHHTVETITFKRQYPKILFPGKSQDEPDDNPQFLIRNPQLIDSINPLNWFRVAREIRKRKPDLLIFKYWLPFFGPCFGTIAKFAKKSASTKVLFICDNVAPHERRPGDIAFTRYALSQADYFIVQSNTVERDLLKLLPNALYKKTPHPIYEIFGDPMSKDEARQLLGISAKKVILYFGYVRPYKGLMVLIDALKKMEDGRKMEDVVLLIVGEFYDHEKKYRQRVKELELEPYIQFVSDYIPNDRVRFYFSAADVVVLPYLSATQSGITQIAYQFEKPVVATNVGGLAEVVLHEQTGYIVPPNDPTSLAEAIWRFYSEGKERDFIENVRREKTKYSWEHFVRQIETLVS